MDPWICALLVAVAGAIGGVVNALLSDNGFILPRRVQEIICPGFLSNVLVGALAAFSSWAAYGSGAGVELARNAASGSERAQISLTFSALAGAFFVGVPVLVGSRTRLISVYSKRASRLQWGGK